jgi:hypothetical protein
MDLYGRRQDNTPYRKYCYTRPYGRRQELYLNPGQQNAPFPIENKSLL